jgi:hypothetical protein
VNRTKRLLSEKPTSLERMLLEAAVKERPSDLQRMRVREAIWEAAPPASGRVAAAGSTAATKGAILGAMGLALVGLVLLQRARPAQRELVDRDIATPHLSHTADEMQMQTSPAALNLEPASAQAGAAQASPELQLRAAAAPAKARSLVESRSAARANPANDASDVRDQIRMIDEARASMDRHNPSAALSSVDRYAAKYPDGMFRQEARILRILALDDRGDHTRATALARAFVASYPTSAHVARIERIADR